MNIHNILAHTNNSVGQNEPLHVHLNKVARKAGEFADAFGANEEAFFCGLLHDVGKLGDEFQIDRLKRKVTGIDHWSFGAWQALSKWKNSGAIATLAIQGHHAGLGVWGKDALGRLSPNKLSEALCVDGKTLSQVPDDILFDWLKITGISIPNHSDTIRGFDKYSIEPAAAMLDTRILFSCLTDADFLETEAHFDAPGTNQRFERPISPRLNPKQALEILLGHIANLRNNLISSKQKPADTVLEVRKDLLEICVSAGNQAQGAYTLAAPTGAGKTLAILAFALKHAKEHSLNRIVVVIPYLSIIEQTAFEYANIFKKHFGESYIIEHHSMATNEKPDNDADNENESVRLKNMRCENWDAPIIITTSVQFFESLFSNRPGACRKLHRLAKSIIIFDEVQTLPTWLAVPTLATLSRLVVRYHSTVVFSTATQPAFDFIDTIVKKHCVNGWTPSEIVSPAMQVSLFSKVRRVEAQWPDENEKVSWEQVAGWMQNNEQSLCIVNLKKHAQELTSFLRLDGKDNLFHLSTNMCPVHRQIVLDNIRGRLKNELPCHVVATQCVEAGVDIDFPVVFRSFGPLEAIVQAAGRCNRNFRYKNALMKVFNPALDSGTHGYPSGTYAQATDVTRTILKIKGGKIDINDPKVFREYFGQLYDLTTPFQNNGTRQQELETALLRGDFKTVAQLYRIIDKSGVNVVVPFIISEYDSLHDDVDRYGLRAAWVRKARYHSVSLYRPEDYAGFLELVPLAGGFKPGTPKADDWFFLLDKENTMYDSNLLGLVGAEKNWIA